MSLKPEIKIKAQKEELPQNVVKLRIVVPVSEWNRFELRALSFLASSIDIPGFRKGKAPLDLVMNHVEEEKIAQEVMEKVLPLSYVEAIKKFNIKPIGSPHIKIIQFEKGKDFIFEAEVSIWPKFKMPNYKNLNIKKEEPTVKKEEIDKEIKILKERLSDFKEKKGKAEFGDQLLISYKGRVNNKNVVGLSREKIWITLSKDVLFEGFGEKIKGAKSGEELNFDLEFGKNIVAKGLAGQKINFWVKVFEIKEKVPTSLKRIAQKLGHKNEEELREKIKNFLLEEKKIEKEREWEDRIIDKLINSTKFEVSPYLINEEAQRIFKQINYSFASRGRNLEQILNESNQNKEEFEKNIKKQAEKNLRASFILNEIAKFENVSVSQKELKEALAREKEILEKEGYSLDQINNFIEREEVKSQILADLRVKKVLNLLKSLNK